MATEDEKDRQVIADADDDTKWEAPEVVAPVKPKPKRQDWVKSVVEEHRTVQCPRCQSFNTRVALVQGEVMLRWCNSCRWRWDYIPEFAPRRGSGG